MKKLGLAWLAVLPLAAGAAGDAERACDLCEDVKLLVDVMESTVRQHTSAKNPQLMIALGEKLGAVCQDHETRPVVICEAVMPRSRETWRLEVLPRDDLAWQQPHRVSLTVKFAAPRAEGVGEFRERMLAGWRPDHVETCQHSVWRLGPLPKTLSMAYVRGGVDTGGCTYRVESLGLYVFSSDLPFPAPRVY